MYDWISFQNLQLVFPIGAFGVGSISKIKPFANFFYSLWRNYFFEV